MMRGPLPLLVVLAVLLAGCGQESTSTTLAPSTTEPAPEAVLLSYQFEPGTVFRYEVEFEQHIVMTASGDPAAMGGEEMPGNADVEMSGVTTFTHTVEEGAEPGTFDISIVGDFTDLSLTGTVDGEPVNSAEIPDFAEMEPIMTTVTVDEQGNVLSTTDGSVGGGDLGALGGMGGMGGMAAPGMDLGTLVGPSFDDREVTVGDSWSDTIENPMPFGGEPITTNVASRVILIDTIEDAADFVIETTSSTSA